MRPYVIQIKNGSTVRLEFGAMAPDSLTAAEQHECLCERGDYVRVVPSRAILRARDLNQSERTEPQNIAADMEQPSAAERERRSERKALEMQINAQAREECKS
jgi:hypothetical protein